MTSLVVCSIGIAGAVAGAWGCSSDPNETTEPSDGGSGGSPAADGPVGALTGKCGDAVPPGGAEAPDPPAYSGGACPTLTTGSTSLSTITSSGVQRQFMVIVPDAIEPGEKLPVVFLWHWLGGSAQDFYDIVGAQGAVNQERFIAIIPEAIGGTDGSNPISRWRGWVPGQEAMREEEFVFFDDMLACVSEQFPVDKNCVSSAGVSDGALWTSQLIGGRSEYLSSAVILSGGVSDGMDVNSALVNTPLPAARALPALVLWGGAMDICIVLQFEAATLELERRLTENGHFILECQHNCGHSVPPIEVPSGQSLLTPFVDFIRSHPYWTPVGTSPYETEGLPAGLPAWCSIGAGTAVPRTGECPAALGCPIVP